MLIMAVESLISLLLQNHRDVNICEKSFITCNVAVSHLRI